MFLFTFFFIINPLGLYFFLLFFIIAILYSNFVATIILLTRHIYSYHPYKFNIQKFIFRNTCISLKILTASLLFIKFPTNGWTGHLDETTAHPTTEAEAQASLPPTHATLSRTRQAPRCPTPTLTPPFTIPTPPYPNQLYQVLTPFLPSLVFPPHSPPNPTFS